MSSHPARVVMSRLTLIHNRSIDLRLCREMFRGYVSQLRTSVRSDCTVRHHKVATFGLPVRSLNASPKATLRRISMSCRFKWSYAGIIVRA